MRELILGLEWFGQQFGAERRCFRGVGDDAEDDDVQRQEGPD
jgi:hypothetical protein